MAFKRKLVIVLAVFAVGYVAYPLVTLDRLHAAVRAGDAATLAALVDWDALRVRMQLRHGVWKVTRAWLPPSLLRAANSRA